MSTVTYANNVKKEAPKWLDNNQLSSQISTLSEIEIGFEPRMKFKGDILDIDIVDKNPHIVFQFANYRKDFRDILAEVVEDHFGSTEGFAIDYVPELDSYALFGIDIYKNPLFNLKTHVEDFLKLLDKTLGVLND